MESIPDISKAPLFLPLFTLIPSTAFSLVSSILYILLDLFCAEALARIAESGESRETRLFTSPRKDLRWDGVVMGAA